MCASVYIDKQYTYVEEREITNKHKNNKYMKPHKYYHSQQHTSKSIKSNYLMANGNNILSSPSSTVTSTVTSAITSASNYNNNMSTLSSPKGGNNTSSIDEGRKISSPSTSTVPNNSNINIEQQCRLLEVENQSLKEVQAQLQQQCADAQRRERILMRRFTNKEQEFQDYISQIAEYKAALAPGPAALRSALLDPAVNLLFEKLKKELQATKAKLEETQNELSAWKFTPDSNTGKRLMAKCRLLYQENEELGKMTSNGRLAKLEGELAMQKSFSEEVKKSQSELDYFLQELDDDVEGMQSTILFLQQELKTSKEKIQLLEKENNELKNGGSTNEFNVKKEEISSDVVNGNEKESTEDKNNLNLNNSCDNKVNSNNKTSLFNPNCNDSLTTTKIEEQTLVNGSIENNKFSNDDQNLPSECNDSSIDNSNFKNKPIMTHPRKRNYEECNNDNISEETNNCLNEQQQPQSDNVTNSNPISNPNLKYNKKIKIKKSRRNSQLTVEICDDGDSTTTTTATTTSEMITEEQIQNSEDEDGGESGRNDEQTNVITRRKSARNHQNGE